MVDLGDVVADHISAGDDLFIFCSNARTAPASTPHEHDPAPGPPGPADAMPLQPPVQPVPPTGTPIAKKLKVYVHYEGGALEKDPTATQAFTVEFNETTVGELLHDFVIRFLPRTIRSRMTNKNKTKTTRVCMPACPAASVPAAGTLGLWTRPALCSWPRPAPTLYF